jgi:hypothetical protein
MRVALLVLLVIALAAHPPFYGPCPWSGCGGPGMGGVQSFPRSTWWTSAMSQIA